MAQEKMVHAGAFADLGAADCVVLLAKESAGYYPLAKARLQDLPEELGRQLVGVADGRAGHSGLAAVALVAPLSGASERPAVRYLLVHLYAGHHPVAVPEDHCRQLAGVDPPPNDQTTDHVAHGYGALHDAIRDYAKLSVLRVEEDGDRSAYRLDASPIPQEPENVGGGPVELRNVFPAWVQASGVLSLDTAAFAPFADKAQFDKNGAAGLGLGALGRSGVVFMPDNADTLVKKLLGNNSANQHGAPYSDGSRRSPYPVQVLVDPAVVAKADDPIAPGAKAAGAGAGRESTRRGVGGSNLSAVLGIVAASSAVTAVATCTVGPAVAFGFFLVLLGGVVAAMAGVRGP